MAQDVGVSEIIQNKDGICFYIENVDMQKIGKLNVTMNGRLNLNLMGRTSMKIALLKNETPLALMRTVLEGLKDEQ